MVGWSTEKMEEKARKHEFKDTENGAMEERQSGREKAVGKQRKTCWKSTKWMSARRSIKRKIWAVGVEKGAESQKISTSKLGAECWARIFSWFKEDDLQLKKVMQ